MTVAELTHALGCFPPDQKVIPCVFGFMEVNFSGEICVSNVRLHCAGGGTVDVCMIRVGDLPAGNGYRPEEAAALP